jgi:hypothetical protein
MSLQFEQPSRTSTVALSTASLSTSTTITIVKPAANGEELAISHTSRAPHLDNPHRLGFEFEKRQVDHSPKGIPSRLSRFDYEHEHRFTEHDFVASSQNDRIHRVAAVEPPSGIGRSATSVHRIVLPVVVSPVVPVFITCVDLASSNDSAMIA